LRKHHPHNQGGVVADKDRFGAAIAEFEFDCERRNSSAWSVNRMRIEALDNPLGLGRL
jgi:hypothetical protein